MAGVEKGGRKRLDTDFRVKRSLVRIQAKTVGNSGRPDRFLFRIMKMKNII
ncbi:hypothetical protein [Lampropedia hyalina]|jgi:hypothetical protein|uniref:hypothetical protein n=1 Tax=Lampropedia hyalina TaxID=198706 RepID=UPI0013564747|nr:hypothetical protein [Lampropedia hyalina]